MNQRLKSQYGPWAIVTGASSGIGHAFATELATAGLNVVLVARNESALANLELILRKAHSVQTRVIVADLAESAGVISVIEGTKDLEIGLLVASAGFGSSGPFLAADIAEHQNMLSVNCDALMTLTHAIGARLNAQRRGGVILLSSLLAWQGVPNSAVYAASKGFVQSLAEGLSLEWKSNGVDVLSCAPGPVLTAFEKRANMTIKAGATAEQVAKASLRALGKRSVVIPGVLSKVLSYSLFTCPRPWRVHIMKQVMAGLSNYGKS